MNVLKIKSYLHRNVTMRFLTCEPYLGSDVEEKIEYVDEADQFFASPQMWYSINQHSISKRVTYLVLFSNLHQKILNMKPEQNHNGNNKGIKEFFLEFATCEKFFNSFVQPTERTDKTILVCARSN